MGVSGWVKSDIFTSTHKQIIHTYMDIIEPIFRSQKKHKHENNNDPSTHLQRPIFNFSFDKFSPKLFFLNRKS